MKLERFIPKLNNEPIEVSSIGSFGQRITNKGTKKIIKQDMIVATDKTIHKIVEDEMKKLGKDADLNHIDVSQVTNMNALFEYTGFHGDISQWDVRNVEKMAYMFNECFNFNCDISNWNVYKVTDMSFMFAECKKFNSDISKWAVGKGSFITGMFYGCPIKEEYKPKFNI